MKNTAHKRRKRTLLIGIPILMAAALLCIAAVYLLSYSHADTEAIEAFSSDRTVTERTLDGGELVYAPDNARIGLIFYPGGKVEHTAYVPLMRELAANGVLCVLCKMPFRLAVFDLHAADGVREKVSGVEQWYIGGHSLGGVIAGSELAAHRGTYDGLILLGSYVTEDLSYEPIRALSVFGSEDGVLNREKYEESKKNLPKDLTETVIEGGCHAYFGMYGRQDGDGEPAITNEEQIRITAGEILTWLKSGGAHAEDS